MMAGASINFGDLMASHRQVSVLLWILMKKNNFATTQSKKFGISLKVYLV